jgi:hypothetical protein
MLVVVAGGEKSVITRKMSLTLVQRAVDNTAQDLSRADSLRSGRAQKI